MGVDNTDSLNKGPVQRIRTLTTVNTSLLRQHPSTRHVTPHECCRDGDGSSVVTVGLDRGTSTRSPKLLSRDGHSRKDPLQIVVRASKAVSGPSAPRILSSTLRPPLGHPSFPCPGTRRSAPQDRPDDVTYAEGSLPCRQRGSCLRTCLRKPGPQTK